MADATEGVVPSDGMSSGTGAGHGVPLSYLNGEWINQRINNVEARVNKLLDRLIDDGLLGSGYPPFETPITDEMLMKMPPEQFRTLYDTLTDVAQKAELLERMKALKLPPIELMPFPDKSRYPVPKPVAGDTVQPVESSADRIV